MAIDRKMGNIMQTKLKNNDIKSYLISSNIIDFDNQIDTSVRDLADKIKQISADNIDFIKNTYEFVRDKISHSADISKDTITCTATEVLKEKHGICFAKSHLLAALLRCKGVPSGFCYQKLILDDETAPFLVYHGLNGVYIKEYKKWIRLDARGNKNGVHAEFTIDEEKLAFPVREEKGELDVPIIFEKPNINIITALTINKTRTQLWADLPTELAF